MDFPIVTRIPSFENSFWIYLPEEYHYNGREASPTGDLQSMLFLHQVLRRRRAEKDLEVDIHMNR